jgi:hypothetical protein
MLKSETWGWGRGERKNKRLYPRPQMLSNAPFSVRVLCAFSMSIKCQVATLTDQKQPETTYFYNIYIFLFQIKDNI